MKVATAPTPSSRMPALSQAAIAQLYRLTGMSILVGVPALFWTTALAAAGYMLEFAVGGAALLCCSLCVGLTAYLGAPIGIAGPVAMCETSGVA